LPNYPAYVLLNIFFLRLPGARFETGYAIDLGGPDAHVVPFVAIEPMLVFQKEATETLLNVPESAITFRKKTITALPMSLGVQIDGQWKTEGGGSFSPLLRLAWLHDFETDRSVTRSFAELPSLLISRTTLPTDTDAASVRFGAQWSAARSWSIKASADAQLSRSYGTIGGSVSVRYVW
jgi:outer membrane autotransporter protein|tara:strand:- start:373 stop:909 length:537 start_codon:yes stop_codon:yes gene_type:complete